MRRLGAALLLAGACGCHHPGGGAPDASPDVAPASAPPASAAAPADAPALDAGHQPADLAPGGEARRTVLAHLRDVPLLAPHLGMLRTHFGPGARGPFVMQRVDFSGARSAVLLARADESDPVLLFVDGARLVWSKERPVAGIQPPVHHLALAAHVLGGASVFVYDPPTHLVAGRVWDGDGAPFADFQVLATDACDALSAAFWPGHGVLVVASTPAGPRAQLLRDDGTLAFPRDGLAVGAPWRAAGPVSIVIDTPDTAVLLMHAGGRGGGDHLEAFRYDASGSSLWAAPVDVAVPRVPDPQERIAATAERPAAVHVALPRGAVGSRAHALRLEPSGAVVRLP